MRHLDPLDPTPLDAITREAVRDLLAGKMGTLGRRSVAAIQGTLHSCLEEAVAG